MDTGKPRLVLTSSPEEAVRKSVLDRLIAFNVGRVGNNERKPLTVLMQDPETGQVNGGLWGRTSWGWLTIETLFVPEPYRACGIGSTMVRMTEQEAIRRQCVGALVDTYSYQAPGFYQKLGYRCLGEVADCPPGHSRIFFEKRF